MKHEIVAKSTKVPETIQRSLALIRQQFPLIVKVVEEVSKEGGRAFLVGGAVRDILMGRAFHDIDIEIHGISLPKLERILGQFGHVRTVGKAFGVLRIDGQDIDWSIPRSDSKGRFPRVTLDEHMPLADACRRRDLTMNAMLIDLATGSLEDPFHGLEDLKAGVLRAPDPAFFVEDPLRFYRVMQFIGRFEMMPDIALSDVCKTMDLSAVSKERIYQEFEKLFLASQRPSLAFKWLNHIGRLEELLPELYATKGVPQNPEYHPEGDVFEHSMQAVDGAAQVLYSTDDERLVMVLAALCHDFGKVETTKLVEGVLRSYGHEIAGVPLADDFLSRVSGKTFLKKPVTRLIRYHMVPVSMVKNNAGPGAYKKLARNLFPISIRKLAQLAIFDKSARNPEKGKPLADCPEPLIEQFFLNAQRFGVLDQPELPLLTGKDFAGEIPEGPALGALLDRAYELQLEKGITSKDELKELVRIMK